MRDHNAVRAHIPTDSAPVPQPERLPLWWLIFAALVVGGGVFALFLL